MCIIPLESFAYTINRLLDGLLPICICVVLPIMLVWLITRARQHEMDKKSEIAIKAIENGAQIDPNLFARTVKPAKRTMKEKFFRRLKAGIILLAVGLMFFFMGLLMSDVNAAKTAFWITASVFFSLGLAFTAIYIAGSKQFEAEISEEDSKTE